MDWRIQTNFIDKSVEVAPATAGFGAMVIRAPKGPKVPTLIQKGQRSKIVNMFGEPSVDFPDVIEALNFIDQSALWLACPYLTTDTYGALLVTNAGSVGVSGGLTDAQLSSYTFSSPGNLPVEETVATIPNPISRGPFTLTLSHTPTDPTALVFELNGTPITGITITLDSGTLYNIVKSGTFTASTYDSATRILTIQFDPAYTPTVGQVYSVTYTSAAIPLMLITSKSPSEDEVAIKASYNDVTGVITLSVYKYDADTGYSLITSYEVSPIPGKKDGYGKIIYAPQVIDENNEWIQVVVNDSISSWIADDSFIDDTTQVMLAGGTRVTASIAASDLVTVWENFQNKNLYPAKVFMSPMHDATIVARFNTLATNYQTYSHYLLSSAMEDDGTEYIVTKNAFGINNKSLVFYHNYFLVKNEYVPQGVYTSLIGAVGTQFARMIQNTAFYAPAGTSENGYGGDLGGFGAVKALYDYSDDQLRLLDEAGINPIIYTPNSVLIGGDKTGQNPKLYSDTSFIPHDMCFKYIIENVTTNVLTNQLFKLNDTLHRNRVITQIKTILSPLVSNGFLNSFAIKCDSGNNNSEILAQRKFVVSVAVKVTPFSEAIIFNFTATAQGIDVNTVV